MKAIGMAITACVVLALPEGAAAQGADDLPAAERGYLTEVYPSRFYAKFGFGASVPEPAGITDLAPVPVNFFLNTPALIIFGDPTGTQAGVLDDIEPGFVVEATVGMRLGNGLRGEVSTGFRDGFTVDDDDAFPSNFKSEIDVFSAMVSAFYDVPAGWTGVQPYVGGGVGVAVVRAGELVNTAIPQRSPGPNFTIGAPGGESTNFAWQAGAGAVFDLGDGYAVDLGYRYFDAGDIVFDAGPLSGSLNGFSNAGAEGHLKAHEVTASIVIDLN